MSSPRILFLDHTGALGGGELSLRDVVGPYRDRSRVLLFADGPFRQLLEADGIAVEVMDDGGPGIDAVRRDSGPMAGLRAGPALIGLARRVATIAGDHDLVYANSQKAALVGAVATRLSRTPLVTHLHDILTADHFGRLNRRLSVTSANTTCRRVIADSQATADAFVAAGGRSSLVRVVHYGFAPPDLGPSELGPAGGDRGDDRASLRAELGLAPDAFVVGHVGRLSPWKGQDVFIRALARVPEATGLIVGSALFGESDVEPRLRALAAELGVADRVVLTGFRPDPARVMAASDLVVHSSTSPEPFGRVIVEAMLVGRPVVAARAGGPLEIIDDGRTGWLTEPGDDVALADRIDACRRDPDGRDRVARAGREAAAGRFTLDAFHRGIAAVVDEAIG